MRNPSGEVDIARTDDLQIHQKEIATQLLDQRGTVATDGHFAYLLGKKSVWVKRISINTYQDCGILAFSAPHETSKLNPLARKVTGRTKTTKSKEKHKITEWV
jgi:hypothetical protein